MQNIFKTVINESLTKLICVERLIKNNKFFETFIK